MDSGWGWRKLPVVGLGEGVVEKQRGVLGVLEKQQHFFSKTFSATYRKVLDKYSKKKNTIQAAI